MHTIAMLNELLGGRASPLASCRRRTEAEKWNFGARRADHARQDLRRLEDGLLLCESFLES